MSSRAEVVPAQVVDEHEDDVRRTGRLGWARPISAGASQPDRDTHDGGKAADRASRLRVRHGVSF
jgi:hypothetical protein